MKIVTVLNLLIVLGYSQTKTIIEIISEDPDLTILNETLVETGFIDVLRNASRPLTILAPNNNAILNQYGNNATAFKNDPNLETILLHHIIAGDFNVTDLISANALPTLNGQSVTNISPNLPPDDQLWFNLLDASQNRRTAIDGNDGSDGWVYVMRELLIPVITTTPVTTTITPNVTTTSSSMTTTTTNGGSSTTTTSQPTPKPTLSQSEINAKEIEELKKRLTAIESELKKCNCQSKPRPPKKGRGFSNKGRSWSYFGNKGKSGRSFYGSRRRSSWPGW